MNYQALDTTGIVTRNLKRRGSGWLFDQSNIGFCKRVGWFCGLRLLLSVTPRGGITGLALAAGSCKDQSLCQAFLQARHEERQDVPVGPKSPVPYLADKGFSGQDNHRRWWQELEALVVICPQEVAHSVGEPGAFSWFCWCCHLARNSAGVWLFNELCGRCSL